MMCFRDTSFCSSDCTQPRSTCDRRFDDSVQKEADAWWGKPGAPIAFMDFSKTCPLYKAPE